MEYVAIDFETANQDPSSACAVGLARFDSDGRMTDSFYSLIRPPVMYFDPVCMAVHGLSPADCRWQETFDNLFDRIASFIGSDCLVAHNAPFDMRVLKASAAFYGIKLPDWQYYCSLAVSRSLLPAYPSHALGYLVHEYLESDYDAHVAISDAEACGRLFVRLLSDRLFDKATLDAFLAMRNIRYPKHLIPSDRDGLR